MQDSNGYTDSKEAFLKQLEGRINETLAPLIVRAAAASEALPESASEEQKEQALIELNDELSRLLGSEMFLAQRPLAEMAAEHFPGQPTPMVSDQELLRQVEMAEEPLSDWFQRRSPSRWMSSLLGAGRDAIQRAVTTVVASAVWGLAARQERLTWNPPAWLWLTEADGKVCGICAPKHQQRYPNLQAAGPYPAHPACRCSMIPSEA